jgi:hypothetical protein
MNLPNEIINYIFRYMSSPTAKLIKDEYEEYLTSYDEKYDIFYWRFSEYYFNEIQEGNKIITINFERSLDAPVSLYLPQGINWNLDEFMNIVGVYVKKRVILRLYDDIEYIRNFINNYSSDSYNDYYYDSDSD